ncbi:MAG: hypothetical protein ACREBD_13885 [Blastocatellia bacterium]
MKILRFCCLTLLAALPAFAQEQNQPRVFITESQSWSTSGGGPVAGGVIVGAGGVITASPRGRGGARPQTAEIIKTFNERWGRCVVTMNKEKADYVVVLDHEGGKGVIRHDNKYALFDKDGDAIKSGSTRNLGTAVKEACEALTRDWKSRNAQAEQPPSQ